MPPETPLYKAHDIAQKLQDGLEVFPNVGRAFVHVDHETTHTPVRTFFLFSASPNRGVIGTSNRYLTID